MSEWHLNGHKEARSKRLKLAIHRLWCKKQVLFRESRKSSCWQNGCLPVHVRGSSAAAGTPITCLLGSWGAEIPFFPGLKLARFGRGAQKRRVCQGALDRGRLPRWYDLGYCASGSTPGSVRMETLACHVREPDKLTPRLMTSCVQRRSHSGHC
jgi:hypothetical protein